MSAFCFFVGLKKAIVNMLVAGIFFALMNILVKYCSGFSTYQIILFRAVITLIISFGFIKSKGLNPLGNVRNLLMLRGLFGFAALSLYFITLQKMPLATAVSVQYLSPLFTAILAIYFNKQKMPIISWLFYAMAFLGVVLIKGFDAEVSLTVFALGIISAIFSGAAYNTIRLIGKRDDSDVIVFYFPLITLPLVLGPAIYYWIWPNPLEWLLLIGVGVCTQFAQLFMTKAYQQSQLSTVAIIQYVGLLYAVLFGWLLFDESYSWLNFFGMALLLLGAIGNTLLAQRAGRK